MPGRPSRHKKLTIADLVREVPPSPPVTTRDLLQLQEAIIQGLVLRVAKNRGGKPEQILEAIRDAHSVFRELLRENGRGRALATVAGFIGTADFDRKKKPTPLELLFEESALYVGKTEPPDSADEAEKILARRHALSPSEIHKLLARASKELDEYRRKYPSINTRLFSFLRSASPKKA